MNNNLICFIIDDGKNFIAVIKNLHKNTSLYFSNDTINFGQFTIIINDLGKENIFMVSDFTFPEICNWCL